MHRIKCNKRVASLIMVISLLAATIVPGFTMEVKAAAISSSDFLKANGKNIRNNYGNGDIVNLRGTNAGGYLLQEFWMTPTNASTNVHSEMDIYTTLTSRFGEATMRELVGVYQDNYWTTQDFDNCKNLGINCIRLPFWYMNFVDFNGNYLSNAFARIDWFLEQAGNRGIYVILDMHGAPGGQTGQNIDDSEDDQPRLFMEKRYEEELTVLWRELAERYREDRTVAGYDLLNEPLPDFFSEYHHLVLPLYRRLIREIRKVDDHHMIILEGVHWATDFSIFHEFTIEEAGDNIMLQFHKYWSNPDRESLKKFMETAERLNVPLLMGEGGENNLDWYTAAFPMFERCNIGWSFWSYKKMDCSNSPVTFSVPEGWGELEAWLEGKVMLEPQRARDIFDHFLACIEDSRVNERVFRALKRQVPLSIPCEAYDGYDIKSERVPGALLRMEEPVTLLFRNGKTGEVNYRSYGGEEQPEEENLVVKLSAGDWVSYEFLPVKPLLTVKISAYGNGLLYVETAGEGKGCTVCGEGNYCVTFHLGSGEKGEIRLICKEGIIYPDILTLC